ncbi:MULTISPECIES: glycoside hydrolase family 31 protein [Mesonia]|uniref:Alpha-xylosidase n=1 Tax=Mesonia oceanica TaxID=2687242 RepID=A0AC61Y8I5_9FLAO|nr:MULTISPECIES: TIM-barrel domain-containing protein [Mesonia]MAN27068.1 alpha-glycosidase [Mesonia sp.]MAQ41422.1 alpha-glycosidase [Mesonia sp.]VVV00475.1 Alpha-xylosidase [Mesonia oceanica]
MKKLGLTLFSLLISCSFFAQQLGDFQKLEKENKNTFQLKTSGADVKVEFCTPSIVRFRTSWDGEFKENEPYMVVHYDWDQVQVQQKETPNKLTFQTHQLNVEIQKSPFQILIYDKQGNLLTADAVSAQETVAATYGATKKLQADEHFFGFGERMDVLDRRGKEVTLNVGRGLGKPHIIGAYNVLEANYAPVPFFMSTKGYGIFYHTAYPSTWDMGKSNPETYSFSSEDSELDYYFIYGPNLPKILDGYTSITGKSPMLPKFAMGLHVGTYSGGTWGHEEETSANYPVALVEKFRKYQIPVDVLHLDSTWRMFGENGGSGATTFEWRETFQNTEKMFDSLYALNLNAVGLHVRPRFDNGKKLRLLDEAREAGYVYPEPNNSGEFVNFFDEDAVDWWWENGAMRVAEQGAMFFKTDEGSAFGRKANESNKTGPQGQEIKSLHNLFPVAYAKAPYEKYQAYNKMRGMNHTREGYAGIQRYPFIWAGDWPSEWQYFEPVIKAGLNIGMSGVGYWSHNMGGFEHVADPELYIRWCQFGFFSPIAHLFGMEHPNYKEPWNYGEEAQRIFKQYDDLRYSLIPYIYSTAYENHTTGMPLMRALVIAYQDDPNVYEITDQYLFGDSMLICPVITKGAKTRTVYLPEGNWTNYWTGEQFEGKQYLNVLCPIEEMPIFIKGGAIIPTQEVVQYVGEKDIETITLDIYPDGKSSFTMYDDDGKSLDYQKGKYALTTIEVNDENDKVEVTIQPAEGNYKLGDRTYQIRLHGSYSTAKSNGKSLEIQQKENVSTVSILSNSKKKNSISFSK